MGFTEQAIAERQIQRGDLWRVDRLNVVLDFGPLISLLQVEIDGIFEGIPNVGLGALDAARLGGLLATYIVMRKSMSGTSCAKALSSPSARSACPSTCSTSGRRPTHDERLRVRSLDTRAFSQKFPHGNLPVRCRRPCRAAGAWWNSLTEVDRAEWMARAGSAVPADALGDV